MTPSPKLATIATTPMTMATIGWTSVRNSMRRSAPANGDTTPAAAGQRSRAARGRGPVCPRRPAPLPGQGYPVVAGASLMRWPMTLDTPSDCIDTP
jgi:hypothetical protein